MSVEKNTTDSGDSKSGEFVLGLVTFVIFIIFMTFWMIFGGTD